MEAVAIKFGLVLKWLIPSALGSAIGVYIGKRVNAAEGFFLFVVGVGIAAYVGAGIVEYYAIQPGAIQACIYLGTGIWGLGIIIQITRQLPEIVKAKLEKWLAK